MRDLDDEQDYYRGPGRRTRGPIHDIYEERGAIDRPCPPRPPLGDGCGAKAGDYCTHPNGDLRKSPCVARDKPPSGTPPPAPQPDPPVVPGGRVEAAIARAVKANR